LFEENGSNARLNVVACTMQRTFDKKFCNLKSSCSICLKLSGLVPVVMDNICVNFHCKRPSTKKVDAWYATGV